MKKLTDWLTALNHFGNLFKSKPPLPPSPLVFPEFTNEKEVQEQLQKFHSRWQTEYGVTPEDLEAVHQSFKNAKQEQIRQFDSEFSISEPQIQRLSEEKVYVKTKNGLVMKTEHQVYEEGLAAFTEGGENNYVANTWAHHAWNRGYEAARQMEKSIFKPQECGYDESIHGVKHPHPGSMEYCKTRFPPQPPIHFEMEPDVEEIAKANARLEMKREHNQYLASSGRVDGFYQEFLDMFDQLDNPTRQTKLEFLQALSLTQRHIIDQLIREQIRENTSTEVD